MAGTIKGFYVLLALWAICELDSTQHREDISLRDAQVECQLYFDELNKGSGA